MQHTPDQTTGISTDRQPAEKARQGRWTAVIALGACLGALNAIWLTYMEAVWNQGYSTMMSLYYNVVFTLVVVSLANAIVRRIRPALALSSTEVLVIFIMGNISTSVAMITEYLVSILAFPYSFSSWDARWAADLIPHLPKHLTVSDPAAVKSFYLGGADLWNWRAIRPWLGPFLGWGLFVTAMVWTGVCLSSIVFNRWRHEERLSFPLVQIPLMITERRVSFHKSSLFWIAFAIAGGIDVLNALHHLYPSVPSFWVKRQTLGLEGLPRPWSSLNPIVYSMNPCLIGLEYFLPVDLLFSLFFFYWAARMEGVALDFLGIEIGRYDPYTQVAPYMREQATGALLALILFALWTSRRRWRESWQKGRMPMPLDRATVGAAAGALLMVGLLAFAGMSVGLAALFVLMYLTIVVSLTRIRAQYGAPSTGLLLGAPGPVIYGAFGRDGLGSQGLAGLAATHWLGREFSGHPTPVTLESFAMTEGKSRSNVVIWCIMIAAVVGYVAAFGTVVGTGYSLGHSTAKAGATQMYFGNEACATFSSRLGDSTSGFHADSMAATGIGAAVVLGLQAIRTKFVAFPLHPVGYALSSTYVSTFIWSTAFVTWLFKLILLRYGGLKGYYRAAPFFLGLILGEFVIGSLLSLTDIATGIRTYVFWPY